MKLATQMSNDRAISLAHSLRADPYPTPDYRVCHSRADILTYLTSSQTRASSSRQTFNSLLTSEDTESLPDDSAYCLTFSTYPGSGRLIYAADITTLAHYRELVSIPTTHHLFHNYLHDSVPFSELNLPIHNFTDTMVMAYNLCLGGGGDDDNSESKAGRGSLSLKSLAYRLCNMRMTSFPDTVYPHSVPHLAQWLTTAAQFLTPLPKFKSCICTHHQEDHQQRGKTLRHTGPCSNCDCPKYKPGPKPTPPSDLEKSLASLYTKSNRLALKLTTEHFDWADPKHDPWKFIRSNWSDDLHALQTFSGPIPRPSIAHVPEPELLNYACRDADATLRLYLHLRHLKPWLFYP